MQCSKCGVSSEKAELYNAISERGIIKICERCAFNEHIPILKKPAKKPFIASKPILPKDISFRMGTDSKTMYNRLSRLSGVQMTEKKPEDIEIAKQNRMLRDVANRNFKERIVREKGDATDLIDDFRWILMRVRRSRHVSTNQLADAIGEPEAAVRMAEQGVLPKNVVPFIQKIEKYLNIRLLKQGVAQQPPKFTGGFNLADSRNFKISDLKTMKRNEVPEPLDNEDIETGESEDYSEDKEIENDSETDIRDILFKK